MGVYSSAMFEESIVDGALYYKRGHSDESERNRKKVVRQFKDASSP